MQQDFNVNTEQATATTTGNGTQPEFGIQRIYIKNLSFEAPSAPEIFRTDWTPEVNLDLDTNAAQISTDTYEVVLKLTATVKAKDKIAFLVEIHQAGIFAMTGFPPEQVQPMLGSFCPNILFPYAREAVSNIVNRGTFPPLYLAPVNFDALYQQYLMQQQKGQVAANAEETTKK